MKRTVALACLACLAVPGCKKDKKQEAAPSEAPTDPEATAPAAPAPTDAGAPAATVPCPGADELTAMLTRSWKPKPTQKLSKPSCAAGRFPEPALAVSAWILPVDTDKGGPALFDYRFELVSADGATLASFEDPDADDPRGWLNGYEPELEVVDLDGDGADEILASYDWIGRQSAESSNVNVYLRDGDKLVEAGHLETRRVEAGDGDPDDPDNPAAIDCSAELAITAADARGRRAIQLSWTVKEGEDAEGTCPTGVVLHELSGDKLVERRAK